LKRTAPLLLAIALVVAPGLAAGMAAPARAAQVAVDDQAWVKSLQDVDELVASGKTDQAIERLDTLLKSAPRLRSSEAHLRLASIYAQRHDWEAAVSHGHDAIEAWPDNGWIYLPVARILVAAHRPEAAIALCEQASERDPAVRLASKDLIYQIRAGTLTEDSGPSPTPHPTPVPVPASTVPYPLVLGILVSLVVLMGGALAWLWRKQWLQSLLSPELPPPVRVEQTGPVVYGPLGVRPMEAGEVIDHYKVVRLVGSSLHSILYCAEDLRLGRQVALKQVGVGTGATGPIMERFQKEVQSLIALSNHHDGVVKVFDFLSPSTLVTEWIEGQNLEECGQLALDEILEAGIALCDVLQFAHARGIIHRDIKPSNIMRTEHTRHVTLLDFGIAKNAALGTSNLTLDANVPIGTFAYMPPEQFAAPNQARPQADIYSLGLTLYRLITSEMPTEPWLGPRTFGLIPIEQFRPLTVKSPAIAVFLERTGTAPGEWIAALDAILRRAFAENPSDRFVDAQTFRKEIEGIWHKIEATV